MTDEELINEIERIRSGNNTRWMDLVRFAFERDPEWARQWQRDVRDNDRKISELNGRLCE